MKSSSDSNSILPGFGETFSCEDCDEMFANKKMYLSHLKSKKHLQNVASGKGKPEAENGKVDSETDDSDLDDEFNCEECGKTIYGWRNYITHSKGKAHIKNLKKRELQKQMKDMPGILNGELGEDELYKPYAQCAICKKDFPGPESYKKHLTSDKHKKKTKDVDILKSLKKDNAGDEDAVFGRCETCDKKFSGVKPYKIHMSSHAHQKALEKAKLADEIKPFCSNEDFKDGYTCKECQKVFSNPAAFKTHLENNAHEKQKKKQQMADLLSAYPEIVLVEPSKIYQLNANEEKEKDEEDIFFICRICHYSFTGPESARDHGKSKKHQSVKKAQEMKQILKRANKGDVTPPANEKSDAKVNPAKAVVKVAALKDSNDDEFELI